MLIPLENFRGIFYFNKTKKHKQKHKQNNKKQKIPQTIDEGSKDRKMKKEELRQAAMINLFEAIANAWYLRFTLKSVDELQEYLSKKSSWANGLRGDEWETLSDCLNAAIEAANFVLEEEGE